MSDASAPPTFEDLLSHAEWLRRLARAVVGDDAVADDLVQETWLSALRSPPRNRTSVRSWLRQVLKRHAYQRYRAEIARAGREAAVARRAADGDTAALVARTEVQSRVIRAVLDLDEPYRTAVLLRYVEDLPPREVARRTAAPVETVRSRLRRAREQLRERLDREDGRPGAWLGALAPLVVPGPLPEGGGAAPASTALATATGVLAMTTTKKLTLAALALLLVTAVAVSTLHDRDGGPAANGDGARIADTATSARPRVATPTSSDGEATPPRSASPRPEARPDETAAATPPSRGAVVVLRFRAAAGTDVPDEVPIVIAHERGPAGAPSRRRPVSTRGTTTLEISDLLDRDARNALEVSVDHPSLLPLRDRIRVEGADLLGEGPPVTEEVTLTLAPAVHLTGRVTDPDGNPLAGAAVGVFVPMEGRQPDVRVDQVRADDLGSWSLRAPPGRDVRVVVCHPLHVPVIRNVAGADVATAVEDVRLEPGHELRVRVEADGLPVDDVEVLANPGYGRAQPIFRHEGAILLDDGSVSRASQSRRTRNGTVTFTGLLPRPHGLAVRVDGAAPGFGEPLKREAAPGDDVVIDVSGALVTVHVTHDGGPLGATDIVVRVAQGGASERFTTDAEGRATLLARRGDSYRVSVVDDAWERREETFAVPDQARTYDVRVEATPAR